MSFSCAQNHTRHDPIPFLASSARAKGCYFMVVVHAVKISRVDTKEQAKSISSLEALNLVLKSRV